MQDMCRIHSLLPRFPQIRGDFEERRSWAVYIMSLVALQLNLFRTVNGNSGKKRTKPKWTTTLPGRINLRCRRRVYFFCKARIHCGGEKREHTHSLPSRVQTLLSTEWCNLDTVYRSPDLGWNGEPKIHDFSRFIWYSPQRFITHSQIEVTTNQEQQDSIFLILNLRKISRRSGE